MTEALIPNRLRDELCKVKRMSERSSKSAFFIDGENNIVEQFSDKYNPLYNDVPFYNNNMCRIISNIDYIL